MTDVIKHLELVDSKDVLKHLKEHPDLIERNINAFREELRDLNAQSPLLLVFGTSAYEILHTHMKSHEYSRLIKLTHYSHQVGKESYRETVLRQIEL